MRLQVLPSLVSLVNTWQRELLYNHPTTIDWDDIAFRFEEEGLDVYDTFTKDYVQPLVDDKASEDDH